MDEQAVRIIRAKVVSEGAVVIRRHELEAVDSARRAVEAAGREAERILSEARQEADRERARGHAEGLAEARRAVAEQRVALGAEATRLRREAGDRLVRLAVELARRVLGQELRTSDEAVAALARRTLTEVSWCRELTLRVHPDDARALRANAPLLAEVVDAGAELHVEPDASLARGACLVESESGEVDGSVETQLARLERALLAEARPGDEDA